MNNIGKTVAKNAGILFSTQFVTWTLSLVVTIFLSRFLGPEGNGKLNIANSLWAITVIFASYGMDALLTKEIARSPKELSEVLSTSTVLRSALFLVGSVVVYIYSLMAGYPTDTIQVIMILGINAFLIQQINIFETIFRGLDRMELYSVPLIISKVVYALSIIAVMVLGYGVQQVAFVAVFASFVDVVLQFILMRKMFNLQFRFQRSKLLWILKAGLPFLFVTVFTVIYQQVDVVILSLLISEESVGWYSAAAHLTGNLLFVPTVFMASIFPSLSRLYVGAKDTMVLLFRKSFTLLLLVGVAIGLGIMLVAPSFVLMIYGDQYEPSGLILSLRGVVLIFTYMNMLLGLYFISSDRQSVWTWVMVVATIVTIPLDLVLIPACQQWFGNGAIGGVISYFITEFGMFLYGFIRLRKEVYNWDTVFRSARILLAGLGMVAITWYFRSMFIAIPVVIGGVSYVGLILLLQVLSKEDRILIASIAQKMLDRFRGRKVSPVDAG